MQNWLCHFILFMSAIFMSACEGSEISLAEIGVDDGKYDMAAHWVSTDTVLIPQSSQSNSVYLISYAEGRMAGADTQAFALEPSELPSAVGARFPHLADWQSYTLSATREEKLALIKGELFVVGRQGDTQIFAHAVQMAGALDDLFTSESADADEVTTYGAVVEGDNVDFRLWAPTAQAVSVLLYDDKLSRTGQATLKFDLQTGSWTGRAALTPEPQFYRYELTLFHPQTGRVETLEVTDPYSLCLSTNSRYSCVIDLEAPDTQPEGWDVHSVPRLDRPEQHIIYEAHIGDFSALDASTPAAARGKYAAFNAPNSAPIQHLSQLQSAGLNTFHILPAYDIGTVDEKPGAPIYLSDTLDILCAKFGAPIPVDGSNICQKGEGTETRLIDVLQSYDPLSANAQALIETIDEMDDFNWGYDPVHYTVPEGSYARNPHGAARVKEFRAMVQALHEMGLRVVMDVVYNHTFKSGLDDKSVLDKIVPGYYYRRNPVTGEIERSTCCENTATEHVMMAKLMTDSLVVWARDYRIDGFRFDLMGHQPKSVMLSARDAVMAVDPDTYFYGEGWNFGEVANNARFVQASQTELSGTSIGTFTDRLRDAVRGGSSFDFGEDLRRGQGIGSAQWVVKNDLSQGQDRSGYDNNLNLVRLGLAGNLIDYRLPSRNGEILLGTDIDYKGAPAGYAQDPADTINYVSKHDNQALWDNHQYRLPFNMPTDHRVRLQVQSLSYVLYAQGIPFLHMGSELLRSKSYLRDSYNYGHWFNRVDFTYERNNYNVGLPPADKDAANWPIITRIITENAGRDTPSKQDIAFARDRVLDMIAVRASSPLFSLPKGDDIKSRIRFLNTGPEQQDGLIVMSIDDGFYNANLENIDPDVSELIVVFNHGPKLQSFPILDVNGLSLHPILQSSADKAFDLIDITSEGVEVPAFTSAVFLRADTQ